MNAEDLIILGALGFGAWYVFNQSRQAAAATGTPAPVSPQAPTNAPMIPAPAPTMPTITPPSNNSILNSSNPILTLATTPPPMPPPAPVAATTAPSAASTSPALAPLPTPLTLTPTPVIAQSPAPNNPIAPTPSPMPAAPLTNNPTTGWTTSLSVQPGDTYTVKISGGIPGGQVMLSLTKDGISQAIGVGYTDPSGNFSYTGSVDSTAYEWSFSWYVNGVYAGNFTLDVGTRPLSTFTSSDPYPTMAPTTSTGMPSPSPTVQPGVVPVASAAPSSITVAPAPAYAPSAPTYVPTVSSNGVYYQVAPAVIPPGAVTPWNI